ncbi:MAG TPA: hypothetical protein VLA93_16420 [Pyrinomonadaceae bacterium]|nr:hypothetical protein [Pyrinomonadaceae bacterium]
MSGLKFSARLWQVSAKQLERLKEIAKATQLDLAEASEKDLPLAL